MFSEDATTRTTDQPGRGVGLPTSPKTRPASGSSGFWEMAVAASIRPGEPVPVANPSPCAVVRNNGWNPVVTRHFMNA
ncbi:hypothetical protein GCM10010191_21400 [Actinomadura vinacea]|uniref:DUF397 domain-containing protein n=1 Tax=Actinomadura vinacea TaxID=115336 RepID=A0ABP5VW76_9ACTN